MIRHQHGVAIGGQNLSPTFEGFGVIPKAMGNHHQTAIGSTLGNKSQYTQGLGPVGHRNRKHLARPGGLQRLLKCWIHTCGCALADQGNTELLVGLQTIGSIHNPQHVHRSLLPRNFPEKTKNVGFTLGLGADQRIREHAPAGIRLNAIEVHQIGRQEKGLLQQWLPSGTL